ncbi:hypothetical protein DFH09DRAFT_1320856 [Mycena vulgaris]|nr:hypothetical protein DFH09DRAFT_1320856 [Mycena vulgaris]
MKKMQRDDLRVEGVTNDPLGRANHYSSKYPYLRCALSLRSERYSSGAKIKCACTAQQMIVRVLQCPVAMPRAVAIPCAATSAPPFTPQMRAIEQPTAPTNLPCGFSGALASNSRRAYPRRAAPRHILALSVEASIGLLFWVRRTLPRACVLECDDHVRVAGYRACGFAPSLARSAFRAPSPRLSSPACASLSSQRSLRCSIGSVAGSFCLHFSSKYPRCAAAMCATRTAACAIGQRSMLSGSPCVLAFSRPFATLDDQISWFGSATAYFQRFRILGVPKLPYRS